jgi:hypothetical protein
LITLIGENNMNLFKTTALALVLGAFGLAHSGGDEAKEQEQPSSRVAKTVSQLHEEIGTIVNNPGASKRKMEAITALLARESEDYTATPISSVSDASTLIGAHSIDELIKRLNITSKNPVRDEEEEEAEDSQGSASAEEDEAEEEEGSGSASASGEEEGDEEEEKVDEEEGVQLSDTAQAFIRSLGLSLDPSSPSEVIDAVIAKISANTEALTAEKEEALKSAAQAKDEAAQAQIKLEQAKSAYTLLEKTAGDSAGAMEARLEAVRADLEAQKQMVAELSEEQAGLYQQAFTLTAVKAALSQGSDAEALAAVRALLNPPAPSEEPAKDQAQGAPRQEQGQGSADSTTTANHPDLSDEPGKDQAQGTQGQGSASSTTTGPRTDASAAAQEEPEAAKSPAKVKKAGTPSKSTKKKKASASAPDAAAAAEDSSAKKEDANA